jgi:alpha-ribazole phosphatase
MPRVVLVRHPRPIERWQKTAYGFTDVEVESLSGPDQAALNRMAKVVGRVYASDLSRARVPAEIAAAAAKKPLVLDARLREINMGAWEGRKWEDIAREDPEAHEDWEEDVFQFSPPGGESFLDLAARVRSWLMHLPQEDVLAVSHGGVMRALIHLSLEIPLRRVPDLRMVHGRAALFTREGRDWKLDGWNLPLPAAAADLV